MSKLSFRARALDPSKQMPIYLAEELPDLPEYSAINRAVPQMPSGMEKEEESEHHLQRAICTGLIIPTPEVYTTDQDFYDKNYPPNYRMPRQLIHMQPLGLEQDVPEYDMDSEDEVWVTQQRKRLDLTPFKFEQMMDRLEKSSGQTVVTLNEAKALLKQDDEVSIAVYDYWLNKRLKMQHPLILSVKTENRPGASSNNPYLAFRRRTEKMQTRKNRKNDETSYEKMLKLRRDLQRATTVLEMVKRREKTKREHVHLSIEIFEKRVQLKDFNGALLSELSATIKNSRPAFAPLYANQYSHHSSSSGATPTAVVPNVSSSAAGLNNVMGSSTGLMTAGQTGNVTTSGSSHMYSSAPQYLNSANVAMDALNAGSRKEKRQYKKRKHKIPRDKQQLNHQQQQQQQQYLATMGVIPTSGTTGAALGAGGGVAGIPGSTSGLPHHLPHHMHHHLHRQSSSPAPNESNIETEEEDLAHKIGSESEEEAPFAFRRKQGCDYLRSRAHTGNWPWEPKEEYGFGDTKYRYTLASIKHPRPRCIGFARRRMGRGGRILLDRVASNFDDFWSQLDYTILESKTSDCTTASVDTTAATTTTKTNNKKDSSTKPASPPTVVDLVPPTPTGVLAATASTTNTNVNNANTPATLIKQEIMDTNNHLLHHLDPAKTSSSLTTTNGRRLAKSDDGVDDGNDDDTDIGLNGDCCEYEYSDDELEDEHGLHIQRDRLYHSCISMARRRRRRRRQQQQQQQNEQNSKRRKLNNAHLQQKNMEAAQRRLLYKLSQSLMMDNGVVGSVNGRVNNLVNSSTNVAATAAAANEAITHDKVNGLNKTDDENGSTTTTWPNHRCASSAANATVLDKLQHTSSNSISTSTTSSSLLAWSSPSTTTTNNNNSSSLVIGISNNHNNNNSSNNVNMNISSNGSRSNSCSISDKTNVIKREIIIQDADSENASTSSCNPGDLLATSRAIKQEMMDSSAPSLASADDSNEPLSSIQKLNAGSVVAAAADIVEDEENLNLAQLSNLIKIKKEEEDVIFEYSNDRAEMFGRNGGAGGPPLASESEDDEVSCFNQMADVIRQRDLSRRSRRSLRPNSSGQPLKGVNVLIEEVATINEQKREQSPEDEVTMLGGLSPTSSQRLDICNELLSEIRRDWLHFRPKTPTETEKEDFWSLDMDYKLTSPLVDWSQQTPIAVEMVRESLSPIRDLKKASKLVKQESSLWKDNDEFESSAFITPAFKYEDLEADTQLLQSSFMSDITRGSSKSPEAANNSACLDLNFSGDSLNDINLLGDGDDADMLDNILQEVQIDDIKTLATNFWNGILDGENVDTEVDGDVEAAAGLLEGIDDATKKCDKSVGGDNKKNTRGKGGKKACAALTPVGSSSFNCSPLEEAIVKDETFFKLEEPKKEPCDEEGETSSAVPEEEVAVKSEPMDVSETKVGCLVPVVQPTVVPNNMIVRLTPQQRQITASTPALVMASSSVDSSNCSSINTQQDVVQHAGTPIVIAQPMIQPQQQQQHHQSSQQPPHLITHSTPLQVIGNTITLNPGDTITTTPHNQMQATSTNSSATVTQIQQQHQQQPSPSQQQQQHQLTTIQVVQQPQGTTQQIRNVTVQQLHQLQLQQQQQRKLQLQQQQQQQKLLMQQRAGELVNAAAAASSSNNSSAGGGASVIAQYIPNTTSNSNTTTTTIMRQPTLTPIGAATIAHNNNSTTGQMIYTTTSAGEVIGTTTGSQKIYLQKAPVSLGSSSGQGVNIINTSSGQQLTVQNIAGVQHINATGNGSNATAGPLIVTTSARNAVQQLTQQQQQQQMVGQQPTQQIVWRQIGSTNVTTTPAGMLAGAATTAVTNADGTVTATMGAGNKIVWTNRPAQKRQLNGPESTDINKVLLNRKFSQRKIITQAHQQILQQQHLQQQQQQQQSQDDDLTTTLNALSGQETTTTGVTYTTQQQQQQQQQHQIQKVTTTGGGGSGGGGKVIKMPSSFPLLVSEVNLQQQQKHNTAAAIAANHNYSLQPTAAIITSQASQQQGGGSSSSGGGNKIYLTASSSGGAATNYTITNASELQSAAQKLQASNSNLKLNFVATTSNANNSSNNSQVVTGGGINVQQQQQTLVLNKATVQQQQLLSQQLLQQQGKLKRERILNIIGAATSVDGSNANATTAGTITATSGTGGVSVTGDNNNKRVLYTSLVNVKQLQKNNTGQMQVQIGGHQAMAHAVLRNRIGNNQIFANMRTVPVATVVASAAASNHNNNVTVASSAGGGGGVGGTTVQVVSSNQQTAAGNLNSNTISVSTNSLSSNEQQQQQQQQQVVNDGSGLTIINSTSDLKSVTVTASSANSGGGGLIENTNNNSSPVTTNNSNSSSNSSSSNGGGNSNSNNNNVTTTNNTTTINR